MRWETVDNVHAHRETGNQRRADTVVYVWLREASVHTQNRISPRTHTRSTETYVFFCKHGMTLAKKGY